MRCERAFPVQCFTVERLDGGELQSIVESAVTRCKDSSFPSNQSLASAIARFVSDARLA